MIRRRTIYVSIFASICQVIFWTREMLSFSFSSFIPALSIGFSLSLKFPLQWTWQSFRRGLLGSSQLFPDISWAERTGWSAGSIAADQQSVGPKCQNLKFRIFRWGRIWWRRRRGNAETCSWGPDCGRWSSCPLRMPKSGREPVQGHPWYPGLPGGRTWSRSSGPWGRSRSTPTRWGRSSVYTRSRDNSIVKK